MRAGTTTRQEDNRSEISLSLPLALVPCIKSAWKCQLQCQSMTDLRSASPPSCHRPSEDTGKTTIGAAFCSCCILCQSEKLKKGFSVFGNGNGARRDKASVYGGAVATWRSTRCVVEPIRQHNEGLFRAERMGLIHHGRGARAAADRGGNACYTGPYELFRADPDLPTTAPGERASAQLLTA